MARKKTEAKPKEPIKIRFRKCADGNQSIYLDYYTGDIVRNDVDDSVKVGGRHKYEYLKLYLVPENTKEDRQKNTTTLSLAKAIQSKRIVELQNDAHGFQNGNKSKANIIDYIEAMREQAKERASLNYWATMGNVVRVLKLYRGDYIAFKDVDKDFLKGFVVFLSKAKKHSKYGDVKSGETLSNNSIVAYYGVIRTALSRAFKDGIIASNPTIGFTLGDKVKAEASQREYLTIDELKILMNEPCKNDVTKRAFLFSCLCGLRSSDMKRLTWGDLKKDRDKTKIEIRMKKTKEPIYLPLSDEALKQLPERGTAKDADVIFLLTHEGTINTVLQKWAKSAGITKHISFHVARHTHATMMLTLGTDLYTVSKLLGHKNIATTQIYAKIVDEKKDKAINKLNGIFD